INPAYVQLSSVRGIKPHADGKSEEQIERPGVLAEVCCTRDVPWTEHLYKFAIAFGVSIENQPRHHGVRVRWRERIVENRFESEGREAIDGGTDHRQDLRDGENGDQTGTQAPSASARLCVREDLEGGAHSLAFLGRDWFFVESRDGCADDTAPTRAIIRRFC